jgi:type VI secretion system protein ImpH
LLGVGLPSLCARGKWDDLARLYYSGHLVRPARNAEGLEQIIAGFFAVPVNVVSFVGSWIELPMASRCALGRSSQTGELGRNVFAGERVWDCQTRFRIRIGPLSLEQFLRFLPGTETCGRLRDLVRFYVGLELAWEVQCVLRAAEVPVASLGSNAWLGCTSWLKTRAFMRDADDRVMSFEERAAA